MGRIGRTHRKQDAEGSPRRDRARPPRRWIASAVVFVLLAACGPRDAGDDGGDPPDPGDLATGLEAISIATGAFEDADGVVRVSLSFPRPGGTAEFWEVTLARGSEDFRRIEIQGKRVVGSQTVPASELDVVRAFDIDDLEFDTDQAEDALRETPPVEGDPELRVSLSPIPLDATSDVPEEVGDTPAWELLITRDGSVHLQRVWVSALNGEVLAREGDGS